MANCGRMVRDSAMVTWRTYRKRPSLFRTVRSLTPYDPDLPFPQMWVPNAPLVKCRISNGHISATGHPIHFMFRSRIEYLGSANQMALFPVRSNRRWRPWHDDVTEDIDKSRAMPPFAKLLWSLSQISGPAPGRPTRERAMHPSNGRALCCQPYWQFHWIKQSRSR